MSYGLGPYGGYAYGVDPVYPVQATSMRRALRIRILLYLILIPSMLLMA